MKIAIPTDSICMALAAAHLPTKHEILRDSFGFDAFRSGQEQAIDAVLADGAGRARNLARQTMDAVRGVVGFVAVLIGAPRVPQPNLRRSPALELASKFAT